MVSAEDFATVYTRAFPLTRKFLQSRGVQPETASDLAQAAWARGWECRGQLRNDTTLHPWINTIAWNLFRNVTSRTPRTIALANVNTASPDLPVEPKILAQELLRHLDPDDRQLLHSCFFLGYSDIEMARRFRTTRGAVRARVHRAKQRLRTVVERRSRAVLTGGSIAD